MGFIIKDGKGRGYTAGVNSNNELNVFSIVRTEYQQATQNGDYFSMPSDFLTISGSMTTHAILYFKNTSTKDYFIDRVKFCASSASHFRFYANPTSGSIISTGTELTPVNCNFASTKNWTGVAKTGGMGFDFVDGDLFNQTFLSGGFGEFEYNGTIQVGPGQSFGIAGEHATPATGTMCVVVAGFYSQD